MNYHCHLDTINKRILFAGTFKHIIFKLFNRLIKNTDFYRITEAVGQYHYDLLQSICCKQVVKYFGTPNLLAAETERNIIQHPKYRSFYYDKNKNSVIGMHLGVDFIKNNNKFFPVDINLKADLSLNRRSIYKDEIDPILLNLQRIAIENNFKKIYCFADYWSRNYVREFESVNKKGLVRFVPATPHKTKNSSLKKMLALPEQLEENSMYLIFEPQHGPVDFYLTNHAYTNFWLDNYLKKNEFKSSILSSIDSYTNIMDIKLKNIGKLPNLVVKLSGGGSAKYVKILKVDDASKLNEKDLLSYFNLSAYDKLKFFFGKHQKLIYQKFIPPEVNSTGCAQIIRSHLLVTPKVTSMLSCHRIVSNTTVPDNIESGLMQNDDALIVNFAKNSHYEIIDAAELNKIKEASQQLCTLIDRVLSEKFITTNSAT